MLEVRSVNEMMKVRETLNVRNIGFVPTMGNLHDGHAALITRSVAEMDLTIVTIFVNPKQFSGTEDFHQYPRTTDDDIRLCKQLGVNILFIPSIDDMFGNDFETTVTIAVGNSERNENSEGNRRPTHFEGVATVLVKLFSIIRPTMTYFGQKDGQQVAVVNRLLHDLFPYIQMTVIETIRQSDGLALSSRNKYLSQIGRQNATLLYRALCKGEQTFLEGCHDGEKIRHVVLHSLHEAIMQHVDMRIDYVSVCHRWTMREITSEEKTHQSCTSVDNVKNDDWLICAAMYVEGTRLLDNVILHR